MTERWTFTATSRGYMFFLDGKPQGGAGTMADAKKSPGRGAAKQAAQYADYCRRECARRNKALEDSANG
jgi:hypothetical protein